MCGRTRLEVPPYDLADTFGADASGVDPTVTVTNLNCAPTDPVLVVRRRRDSEVRELVTMRWGLVPFYVRDFRDAKPLINARAETVARAAPFREAYKRRRCLVVADGFYEWRHEGKKKLPHVIQRPDRKPFGMAGIWDRWKNEDKRIETCAVLTRDPSAEVAAIHDRMPLALEPADYATWLDPNADPDAVRDVLGRAVTDWVVTPIERMPDPPGKRQLALFG